MIEWFLGLSSEEQVGLVTLILTSVFAWLMRGRSAHNDADKDNPHKTLEITTLDEFNSIAGPAFQEILDQLDEAAERQAQIQMLVSLIQRDMIRRQD